MILPQNGGNRVSAIFRVFRLEISKFSGEGCSQIPDLQGGGRPPFIEPLMLKPGSASVDNRSIRVKYSKVF